MIDKIQSVSTANWNHELAQALQIQSHASALTQFAQERHLYSAARVPQSLKQSNRSHSDTEPKYLHPQATNIRSSSKRAAAALCDFLLLCADVAARVALTGSQIAPLAGQVTGRDASLAIAKAYTALSKAAVQYAVPAEILTGLVAVSSAAVSFPYSHGVHSLSHLPER